MEKIKLEFSATTNIKYRMGDELGEDNYSSAAQSEKPQQVKQR